jgi:hypothetical protein
MDLLGSLRLIAGDYGDYDHIAVAPAGLAGLLMAAAGMALALSRRSTVFGRGRGAAAVAAGVLDLDWRPALAAGFALQLLALATMENVEHFSALGTPSEGLDWLGGPPLIALALHLAIACAFAFVLRRSLAGVLSTCAAIVAFVAAVITGLRAAPPAPVLLRAEPAPRRGEGRSPLSDHRGFRAPPFAR